MITTNRLVSAQSLRRVPFALGLLVHSRIVSCSVMYPVNLKVAHPLFAV
ncbi:hypothetical protein ACL6C3_17190 [Capilliphycus salinus ALCB114379]